MGSNLLRFSPYYGQAGSNLLGMGNRFVRTEWDGLRNHAFTLTTRQWSCRGGKNHRRRNFFDEKGTVREEKGLTAHQKS